MADAAICRDCGLYQQANQTPRISARMLLRYAGWLVLVASITIFAYSAVVPESAGYLAEYKEFATIGTGVGISILHGTKKMASKAKPVSTGAIEEEGEEREDNEEN